MISRFRERLRPVIRWVGDLDLIVMLALLVAVVALWGFLALADEVAEGDTKRVDEAVILALRNPDDPSDPIGSPWVEEVFRDLTALGGFAVIALVEAAVVGFLLLHRKYQAAGLVLVATFGGMLLSNVLKGFFARPRPDLVSHLSHVSSSSFPSGHSINSAVVYLTLASLLDRVVERPAVRLYILAVALVLTGLVGISRVYLGVHYPTDVLAGWAVGLAWAVLCWLVGAGSSNAARSNRRSNDRPRRPRGATKRPPPPVGNHHPEAVRGLSPSRNRGCPPGSDQTARAGSEQSSRVVRGSTSSIVSSTTEATRYRSGTLSRRDS